jgi:hypothetical protein
VHKELSKRREQFLRVAGRDHPAKDVGDHAVRAKNERTALDAHELPSVALAQHPDPVILGDLVVGVGEQRERQAILRLERGLGFYCVWAAPDDGRALALKLIEIVTDFGGFGRSAGGVGPGEEIQDQGPAAEVIQRNLAAVVRRRREARRLIPNVY